MAKVKRNFPLYSTLLHFSSLLLKTLCFPLATYWLIDIYSDAFFLIPHKELYPYLMLCSTIIYAPEKSGQALRAKNDPGRGRNSTAERFNYCSIDGLLNRYSVEVEVFECGRHI
jgi:hypothetical protein